jgi:hypothetical protein
VAAVFEVQLWNSVQDYVLHHRDLRILPRIHSNYPFFPISSLFTLNISRITARITTLFQFFIPKMWSFKKNSPFILSEDDMDDESKTGLLSQSLRASKSKDSLRLHAVFALLHAVIAMLWLSTFWTFAPLCRQVPELLRPLELRE